MEKIETRKRQTFKNTYHLQLLKIIVVAMHRKMETKYSRSKKEILEIKKINIYLFLRERERERQCERVRGRERGRHRL